MPNVETFRYNSPYGTYDNCYLEVSRYADNGRIAIRIWNNEDGCIASTTVNIDAPLSDNEIAIKDYSENTGMLLEMQKIGLVKEVVRFHPSGYVSIPICKYDKDILKKYSGFKE